MTGFSILTVCTGNVHRSPLAAVLLDRWARWYLPGGLAEQVAVTSAGTAAPVGAAMGRRPLAIAEALGADGSAHRASQLSDAAIVSADLVLVASRAHRDAVLSRVPSAMRRTFTFREAGRIAGESPRRPAPRTVDGLRVIIDEIGRARPMWPASAPAEDDVIDPEGREDDAYRRMAAEEVPALAALAAVLLGMPQGDVDAYRVAAADPALALGPTGGRREDA